MRATSMDKIAQILAEAEEPALKRQLIQRCGLSSETFKEHVQRLTAYGLLSATPALNLRLKGFLSEKRMIYQTTEKGKIFLQKYYDGRRGEPHRHNA